MSGGGFAGDGTGSYHRNGPDTERQAAESIAAFSGALRQQALALLVLAGNDGLTDDEGGRLMGGDRLTFGRRRHELVEAGYVHNSGRRRLTPTGRNAVVWVVTQYHVTGRSPIHAASNAAPINAAPIAEGE